MTLTEPTYEAHIYPNTDEVIKAKPLNQDGKRGWKIDTRILEVMIQHAKNESEDYLYFAVRDSDGNLVDPVTNELFMRGYKYANHSPMEAQKVNIENFPPWP